MIRVSVLIPVYNQESLIKKCIDSIPRREDIEIVVVNDCSTDNTLALLNSYKDIKIINNKVNLGIGATRNVLLDNAKGDYVFFLDSDDYLYGKVFLDIIDKDLKNQVVLKPMCERNDGYKWYSAVHRGDFVKRSFIGDTRHPDIRCGEDSVFKGLLRKKSGYNEQKLEKLVYHYNEPRIDSLSWENRKKIGKAGYDKGIEEWERVYGKR